MKRAVITGLGIVSCLGNDRTTVKDSLTNGNSGIKYREDFNEMGLKCHVGGVAIHGQLSSLWIHFCNKSN